MRKILLFALSVLLAPAVFAQNTGIYVVPVNLQITGANAGALQGVPLNTTLPGVGQCLLYDGTQWSPGNCGGGGGSVSFSAITAGTNTKALLIGTGGSLGTTGTGTINATAIGGITVTGTPADGNCLVATSSTAADWKTCGGGGGGGGQIDFPISVPTRMDTVGFSISGSTIVSNTVTTTSLLGGGISGRQFIPAGAMLPATNGIKTIHLHGNGVLSTAASIPTLNVVVLLGGGPIATFAVPLTASLSATGWDLDMYFTVNTLTTGTAAGCLKFIGASNVETGVCVNNAFSGFNFATSQTVDVQATWGTASASDTLTVYQLAAFPVTSI
jgi:hypothetical protein